MQIPDDLSRQRKLDTYIQRNLDNARNILYDLKLLGKLHELSDADLKAVIEQNDTTAEADLSKTKKGFIAYFEHHITTVKTPSTRSSFELALKKVKEFDPSEKPFSQVNTA